MAEQKGFLASLKEAAAKVWDGATPFYEHGAHEAASALFRGDAFVMYPRTGQGNDQETTMDSLRADAQVKREDQSKGLDSPEQDRGMEL